LDALNSALKTDPGFALGYAELGEAYRVKYTLDRNPKWTDEALANCRKAAQLDDRLPMVYVTLGRIHASSGKYDLALQEFQRALQKSVELSPTYPGYANLGYLYVQQQRCAEAGAALEEGLPLNGKAFLVWGKLMLACPGLGNPEKSDAARDRERALLEQGAES